MSTHALRWLPGWLFFTFLTYTASAQRLYVFAVINPGESYRADRERLIRLADSLAFYGGYRQIRYEFRAQPSFKAPTIRKTLEDFRPENDVDDMVWFHYAGRGYANKPGAWPTMRMGRSELAGRDVLALLRSKSARTTLVTFDCGSRATPDSSAGTSSNKRRKAESVMTVRPQVIRNSTTKQIDTLTISGYRQLTTPARIRQIIVMAAASHGQRAYRTRTTGSVWLETLERVMHEAVHRADGVPAWKQMQTQLSQLVQRKTGNRQTPQYNRQTITCCETDTLHQESGR